MVKAFSPVSPAATLAPARADVLKAVAVAFSVGAALVFFTGFAGADVLHNAAHDWRHAMSFPCH
ncbi:CbtB domain-containing protein [Mongoliimonas terrestris]|uniref:CbtB domain-containing protein n=1 Tax=Mongoliimonas terrestris TaxID=1709001 RepID=UPI000949910B|nr:CbtB-domain containing protein [Mongoliimonas terrestris]